MIKREAHPLKQMEGDQARDESAQAYGKVIKQGGIRSSNRKSDQARGRSAQANESDQARGVSAQASGEVIKQETNPLKQAGK
ncbi:Uncharacterised protein [Lysinibacillus sphaericus]|nr:Uncharacterised protein [Lysinibacillus sphaericus]